MQSVCAVLPAPFRERVVQFRSTLVADPVIGRLYDPPFVHFTLQLAEDYDWSGLEQALTAFAQQSDPFELRTVGFLAMTGSQAAITIAPYKDQRLADFQAAVWRTVSPFARGRVDAFYDPDRWVPHVTVKRCGADAQRFGAAMAQLAHEDVRWTMTIDNIAVQHDPAHNSLTHYQRLYFPLGRAPARAARPQADDDNGALNATLVDVREHGMETGALRWRATIQPDEGLELVQDWSAPELVRLMADAEASLVHFSHARCRLEGGRVLMVAPATPFSIARSTVYR